uniref:Secreted protein n=1 Tax=Rhipicephalus zambeziensis TaxID=60191 RepID=A0A224Y6D0_9ACAR
MQNCVTAFCQSIICLLYCMLVILQCACCKLCSFLHNCRYNLLCLLYHTYSALFMKQHIVTGLLEEVEQRFIYRGWTASACRYCASFFSSPFSCCCRCCCFTGLNPL